MADATTEGLAQKLVPHVQDFLSAHRQDFIDRAGGPFERTAVKFGLPLAVREVPVIVEHGLEKLADELSGWSLGDLVRWLESVAEHKGQPQGRLVREYRSSRP